MFFTDFVSWRTTGFPARPTKVGRIGPSATKSFGDTRWPPMGNPSCRARLDAYQTDYQGVVAWMVMDRGLRLGQSVLLRWFCRHITHTI